MPQLRVNRGWKSISGMPTHGEAPRHGGKHAQSEECKQGVELAVRDIRHRRTDAFLDCILEVPPRVRVGGQRRHELEEPGFDGGLDRLAHRRGSGGGLGRASCGALALDRSRQGLAHGALCSVGGWRFDGRKAADSLRRLYLTAAQVRTILAAGREI